MVLPYIDPMGIRILCVKLIYFFDVHMSKMAGGGMPPSRRLSGINQRQRLIEPKDHGKKHRFDGIRQGK